MSKFQKKRGKSTPTISTASLPDIIFILLFFFMVVTVMRTTTLMVQNRLPKATELTKLTRKSLTSYIYIGQPKPEYIPEYGDAPRIQLNDKFATAEDIPAFVESERNKREEGDRDQITWALRVDREAKMGLVSDVKLKMRKADALKINYSALPDLDY